MCDSPAQPAEQEGRTQSPSPGLLSVELLRDSSPLGDSKGRAQWGRPDDLPGAAEPPLNVGEAAVLRMSRETPSADDLSERLADATAEYVADTADNQARILFEMPGSLGPEEVNAVLDGCQQKLVDMVKAPVEQVAAGVGAPPLATGLAAGIGADFVLAREIRLAEGISAIIDICVIGIGYAAGQPHLVAVAVKHLSRIGFHEAVQRGVSEILEGLRKPAAPPATVSALPVKGPSAKRCGPGDERNPSPGF